MIKQIEKDIEIEVVKSFIKKIILEDRTQNEKNMIKIASVNKMECPDWSLLDVEAMNYLFDQLSFKNHKMTADFLKEELQEGSLIKFLLKENHFLKKMIKKHVTNKDFLLYAESLEFCHKDLFEKIKEKDSFFLNLIKSNRVSNKRIGDKEVSLWVLFHLPYLEKTLKEKWIKEKDSMDDFFIIKSIVMNYKPDWFTKEEIKSQFETIMSLYRHAEIKTDGFTKKILNYRHPEIKMKVFSTVKLYNLMLDIMSNKVWKPFLEEEASKIDKKKYKIKELYYSNNLKHPDYLMDLHELNSLFLDCNILIKCYTSDILKLNIEDKKQLFIKKVLGLPYKSGEEIKEIVKSHFTLQSSFDKITHIVEKNNLLNEFEIFGSFFSFKEKKIYNEDRTKDILISFLNLCDRELNIKKEDFDYLELLYKD
tara:strand:- start:10216 stop:11481 length:1266 start_codon:yes stop_codon:yes gene_type:complete